MELKDLRNNYEKLSGKYKMPSFKEINESFEIDKIDKESDTLLRVIRKVMMEKIVNSLGFLEMLLNPMNIPRMYMPFIKAMNTEDKKVMERIYTDFSELSLSSLQCEVDYSEKGEAELIKSIFKKWHELKPEFRKIFGKIKNPGSEDFRRERTYFG